MGFYDGGRAARHAGAEHAQGLQMALRLSGSYRPPLDGERYLTGQGSGGPAAVSRRTLQEYRNGRMPYILWQARCLSRTGLRVNYWRRTTASRYGSSTNRKDNRFMMVVLSVFLHLVLLAEGFQQPSFLPGTNTI